MSRTNTDQIIAHVDLLRSIDRLLSQAEIVRKKRVALDKLLSDPADTLPPDDTSKTEGARAS
jgi:hypothetical protein